MQQNRRGLTITQFLILLFAVLLVIVGALYFFNNRQPVSTSSSSSSPSSVQVINQNNQQGEYRSVISNGNYLTSSARGMTVTTESNFNAQSFELSLNELSKRFFSTRRYIFQEGQYLSSDLLSSWLDRYSNSNRSGLNPPDNGRTDDSRNPYYLQSIEENDFMNQVNGTKLNLEGMTIGLAMNRIDHYTRALGGPEYTQNISRAEMIAQGRTVAAKVLRRLRSMNQIPKDLPILIVMYENAPEDSLAGGAPYAYYLSKSGNTVGKWTNVDFQNVVFPKTDTDRSSIGTQDNTNFVNFKNEIQNFFPNISYATAQAHYENGSLNGLNININTSFYSVSEIKAFATYIAETAPKYFNNSIPIRISLSASNQLMAVITKDSNSSYRIIYLYSY